MPLQKPSRLRRTASLRNLVRETRLCVDDLIRPIFVTHSNNRLAIESMPGQFHFPLDEIEKTTKLNRARIADLNAMNDAFENLSKTQKKFTESLLIKSAVHDVAVEQRKLQNLFKVGNSLDSTKIFALQ